jgi:hypothetical protein
MMGPTARLIEEKKPAELTRQTIAREIEAAFAAEASSDPIRLPATIFVVAARRPVSNAIKPQIGYGDFWTFAIGPDIRDRYLARVSSKNFPRAALAGCPAAARLFSQFRRLAAGASGRGLTFPCRKARRSLGAKRR